MAKTYKIRRKPSQATVNSKDICPNIFVQKFFGVLNDEHILNQITQSIEQICSTSDQTHKFNWNQFWDSNETILLMFVYFSN